MTAPRGVRKVSENIVQDGRALTITEEDASKLRWENIPDGTLKINPKNGLMSIKLEGETDWLPAGLKNDGTLCIIKDSMMIQEDFTITSLPSIVNGDYSANEFSYTNSDGETRHMPITLDNELIFELEKGSYTKLRNHLSVVIDDVLHRSQLAGGVRELTETRFAMTEVLEVGQKITAKYVRVFRIGNPYPRVFMDSDEPEASEQGDLWIDFDGTLADGDVLGENIEVNTTLSWDRITGKPTTVKGYGIIDKISYEGHPHKVADISDFPKTMPAKGGDSDTTDGYHAGTTANTLCVIQPDGKIPLATLPDHQHTAVSNLYVGTTPPANPVNNQTIWFCIAPGDTVIKYYANNTWNSFGSVFL